MTMISDNVLIVVVPAMITAFLAPFALKVLDYLQHSKEMNIKAQETREKLVIQDKDGIIQFLNKSLEVERTECKKITDRLTGLVQEQRIRIDGLEAQVATLRMDHVELPMPYFSRDMEGKFKYVNKAAIKYIFGPLGLHTFDLIGHSFEDVLPTGFINLLHSLDHEASVSLTNSATERNVDLIGNDARFMIQQKEVTLSSEAPPLGIETWIMLVLPSKDLPLNDTRE